MYKHMDRRRNIPQEQITALIEYVERFGFVFHCTMRTQEARDQLRHQWELCAEVVNRHGEARTGRDWAKSGMSTGALQDGKKAACHGGPPNGGRPPGPPPPDLDLLIAYHCCERSTEVTKQVLDLHYTLRTIFSQFFKDRILDKKTEFVLDTILFAGLPIPTVDGYKAAYVRLLDYDPRNFNFVESVRTFMMIFDLWQHEQGTWPGFVLVIDMDKAVMGHVVKLEVMAIRQVLYFLQECMLVKLKEVHFMNAPFFMDKLMMLLKPFMQKALLDMIHIHQPGSPSLYESVPKKALPKEQGGEHQDHMTIHDELLVHLQANRQFFVDENRRRVNQAKRPGKATTVEDLFGIQGSFKKLDID